MDFFKNINNAKFILNDEGDKYVLREIYEENTYELDIQPEMTVLDIGANKGIFSVWCAKQGAEVTAYEPNPVTFDYLIKNLQMNDVKVTAVNYAVWKEHTNIDFYPNIWNSGGSTLYPRVTNSFTEPPISVPTIPLDVALGSQTWDVVKIDTEGAEYEIILASDKLNQIRRLEIECHYWNEQGGNPDILNNGRPASSVELFDQTIEKLSGYFTGTKVLDQRQHKAGLMLHLINKETV